MPSRIIGQQDLVSAGFESLVDDWAQESGLSPDSPIFNMGSFPQVNVDNYVHEDDPVGDYTEAFERASLALSSVSNSPGGIILVPGVRETRYIKLRTGIRYVGTSFGNRLGNDGSVIKALAGAGTTNFIYKENPQVRSWGFHDIVINGNKGTNAASVGLYLYKENDGLTQTNDQNEYGFLHRVFIRNFDSDGVYIGGAGSSGGNLYNIKNLYWREVSIRDCGGFGINANQLTDSYFSDIIISKCNAGALNFNSCSNNVLDYVKGFYNGSNPTYSGSFRFNSCNRNYLNIVAQEEYMQGVYISGCVGFYGWIQADANGFPAAAAVNGLQIRNTRYSTLIYIADSFHAPDFLQGSPLRISATSSESLEYLSIDVKSRNQTTNSINFDVDPTASKSGLEISFNGNSKKYGIAVSEELSFSPGYGEFTKKITGAVTGSNIDEDITNPVGPHQFRKWRYSTKTSGVSFAEVWYAGDGTNTTCHKLNAGGNAEFCQNGSFLYNGPHLILGGYHLWADSNGQLRYKNTTPSSARDGLLVGGVPEPIYISGNYMFPPCVTSFASGGAIPTGRIALQTLFITKPVTISELFAKVVTASTSGKFQLALYNSHPTTGKPTTLLTNTGDMSSNATGNVTGVLPSNVTLDVGLYWMAICQDNAVAAFLSTTGGYSLSTMIGSSNLSAVGGNASGKTGYYTASTFGTWPADLTSISLTEGAGNSNDAIVGWKVA